MVILGIETSCDETSASIVEDGTKLLSLVTATSQDMHIKYGGIIPDKAARAQLQSILPVIKEAVVSEIDAIAVTYGPGLIGSLLIGVETAKSLALAWNKPLIPVNHLIGHIYASWLDPKTLTSTQQSIHSFEPPQFPVLALIASGAHCDLVLLKDHNHIELLGSTLDDAAGECFDKCGRLLGLPYPYGPFIQDLAQKHQGKITLKLPRPLLNQNNWDFSFSGLKTAFLYEFQAAQKSGVVSEEYKSALAYELQEAVTDILSKKFVKAALKFKPKSLILTGGVAANKRLREKLLLAARHQIPDIAVHIPPVQLCTDNAAYIASAAYFRIARTTNVSSWVKREKRNWRSQNERNLGRKPEEFHFHPQSQSLNKINADPSLTVTSVISK